MGWIISNDKVHLWKYCELCIRWFFLTYKASYYSTELLTNTAGDNTEYTRTLSEHKVVYRPEDVTQNSFVVSSYNTSLASSSPALNAHELETWLESLACLRNIKHLQRGSGFQLWNSQMIVEVRVMQGTSISWRWMWLCHNVITL